MLEQWTVWILGILKHAGDFQNKCLHCSLYLFYRVTFNTWLILQKIQLLLIVTYRRNVVLSSFDMFVHEQDIIAILQEYIFSAYQFQKTVCRSIYSARVLWTTFMVLYWSFWRRWRSAFTAAWINQMKPCKWILQNTSLRIPWKKASISLK